jgi:hypothetical protein
MELDWYCTGSVGMKQQSCWGVLWFFKRPQVSPLEKQINWQHDIWCLITNTWANRVEIVSSVITTYLTLAKHRTVTIQPTDLFMRSASLIRIRCQFICCFLSVLFVPRFDSILLCWICFCSTIQCSITWSFSVIFCTDTGIVFQVFDPQNYISTTIWQVNKHHLCHLCLISSIESKSL